ncbi:unnamed protein product [Durusdinium trenchii]|uniref:Transmembrane protein n=1 Tax=Durusdinium trenchii TaxID=1381693 RepID=A0ABP0IYX2_9DINO
MATPHRAKFRLLAVLVLLLCTPFCSVFLTATSKIVRYAVTRYARNASSSSFESGLSIEEMLNLAGKRKSAGLSLGSSLAQQDSETEDVDGENEDAPGKPGKGRPKVLIPEVLPVLSPNGAGTFGRQELATLPCVFCPSEEGTREIGAQIDLQFWQNPYQLLWSHALKQTAGAVAVRFSKGSLRRSPHVFALWPAEMGESGLRGLNLGMYNLSVKSVNPFPVVRLLGVNEDGGRDPSDLHSFLRRVFETIFCRMSYRLLPGATLAARTLLGTPGLTTSNKKLLGAPPSYRDR